MTHRITYGDFPTASAVLFGLGLGGLFDAIVFRQMLQWHHMVSGWVPPVSLESLRTNTRWDGCFHGVAYLFVLAGIALLWRKAGAREVYWSHKLLAGGMLIGWGAFNLVEGVVDQSLLGIHHFNETAPLAQQPYWDLLFLLWGLLMVISGRALQRLGRRRQRPQRPVAVAARGGPARHP